VIEVSDERLDDSKNSSVDDGSMVSALVRDRKRPLLSRRGISVIFIIVSVCSMRGNNEVFRLHELNEA
jgi:hypothetical protein